MEEQKDEQLDVDRAGVEADKNVGAPSSATTEDDKPEARKSNVFEKIICWTSFAAPIALAVVMLVGITNAFGKSVNIANAVMFFISLFSIKMGAVYVTLAKLGIVIAYVAIVAVTIKNIVRGARNIKPIIKSSPEHNKRFCVQMLYGNAARSLFYAVCFIALCHVLSGDGMNAGSYVALISLGAIVLCATVTTILMCSKGSANIKRTVFNVLRPFVYTGVFIIAAKFIVDPSLYNLAYGVRIIFGGHFGSGFGGIVNTLYVYAVKDVLSLVAVYFLLDAIYLFVTKIEFMPDSSAFAVCDGELKKKFIRIIVVVAISIALEFIVSGINIGTIDGDAIGSIMSGVRLRLLPALLIAAAGLVFACAAVTSVERGTERAIA